MLVPYSEFIKWNHFWASNSDQRLQRLGQSFLNRFMFCDDELYEETDDGKAMARIMTYVETEIAGVHVAKGIDPRWGSERLAALMVPLDGIPGDVFKRKSYG